jgi:hypothetical protein
MPAGFFVSQLGPIYPAVPLQRWAKFVLYDPCNLLK